MSSRAGSAHTEHIELTVKPASSPLRHVVTMDTPLAACDSADVNDDAVMLGISDDVSITRSFYTPSIPWFTTTTT